MATVMKNLKIAISQRIMDTSPTGHFACWTVRHLSVDLLDRLERSLAGQFLIHKPRQLTETCVN